MEKLILLIADMLKDPDAVCFISIFSICSVLFAWRLKETIKEQKEIEESSEKFKNEHFEGRKIHEYKNS